MSTHSRLAKLFGLPAQAVLVYLHEEEVMPPIGNVHFAMAYGTPSVPIGLYETPHKEALPKRTTLRVYAVRTDEVLEDVWTEIQQQAASTLQTWYLWPGPEAVFVEDSLHSSEFVIGDPVDHHEGSVSLADSYWTVRLPKASWLYDDSGRRGTANGPIAFTLKRDPMDMLDLIRLAPALAKIRLSLIGRNTTRDRLRRMEAAMDEIQVRLRDIRPGISSSSYYEFDTWSRLRRLEDQVSEIHAALRKPNGSHQASPESTHDVLREAFEEDFVPDDE